MTLSPPPYHNVPKRQSRPFPWPTSHSPPCLMLPSLGQYSATSQVLICSITWTRFDNLEGWGKVLREGRWWFVLILGRKIEEGDGEGKMICRILCLSVALRVQFISEDLMVGLCTVLSFFLGTALKPMIPDYEQETRMAYFPKTDTCYMDKVVVRPFESWFFTHTKKLDSTVGSSFIPVETSTTLSTRHQYP